MKKSRLYHFCVGFFRILRHFAFHAHYVGTENIPRGGKLIVCCNHRSVYDPLLLSVPIERQIRFMAKSELFTDHGRFADFFLRRLGAFPVRRGVGDIASLRRAEGILRGGGILGIFPQGHCVPEGKPFALKEGAAMLAVRAQAPVLPAAICCKGPLKLFSRVTVRFGSVIVPEGGLPASEKARRNSAVRAFSENLARSVRTLMEENV